MGYKKCPRCELNYIRDDQQLCDVCSRKRKASDDDNEEGYTYYIGSDARNYYQATDAAKLILDKYKGGEKLLPIQDPADINKYLKDIAILCGINKRICFHTSRHTFASTVTLANNISLEVVSKMLGHTNTRMTAHYAKLIDKCIGEQMDKLMDTFTGASDY